MIRIATIDAGLAYQTRTFEDPPFAERFGQRIPLRRLEETDLAGLPCLMIPCRTNGVRLAPHKAQLAAYVDAGGTLVVMGETHPELFLSGLQVAPEPTNFWWWLEEGADLGVRIAALDHPLVADMSEADVTWHVHGTLQFEDPSTPLVTWSKDGHPQPILSLQMRGRGRLIVTTLDPIYHHGSGFMPATTAFLTRFLPALCQDW
ncbi:MAG: hypothetical protein AAGA32_03165 [Pseudomonadota bacterium]